MQLSDLNYETTVISPGGLECEIHDLPENINQEVYYSVIGQVWPDSADEDFPNGATLVRVMDAYTFCELFSVGRIKGDENAK